MLGFCLLLWVEWIEVFVFVVMFGVVVLGFGVVIGVCGFVVGM